MMYYNISKVYILQVIYSGYRAKCRIEVRLILLKKYRRRIKNITKGQLIVIASAAAVVATATTLTIIAINKKKAAAKAAVAEVEVAEEVVEEATEEVVEEATEEVAE